jgi:hypothetical protein
MGKFKAGDRIRIYGFDPEDAAKSFVRCVDEVNEEGLIITDGGEWAHPKQCRKIVKHEKRRVWLSASSLSDLYQGENSARDMMVFRFDPSMAADVVEFVEVRRKR